MAHVLVVDDHHGIAQAVAQIVRAAGCQVSITHTGGDALGFLRSGRVDLVILDVSMPGISGLDVLREMGAEGMLPGTPVVMFSASAEYREKLLMLGAVGFVLKHEADDLIEQIEGLLRCKGVPPEAQSRPLGPDGSGLMPR